MEVKSIEDWCEKFNIKYYDITEEGFINVNNDANISYRELYIIPIKFGIVTGDFHCYSNKLLILNGSPKSLGGSFICFDNKLKSLEGGPIKVGNGFDCSHNNLTSLEGGPRKVGGRFQCAFNPVYDEFIKYDSYTQYMRSIKLKELL
jgi:hypothetical protein